MKEKKSLYQQIIRFLNSEVFRYLFFGGLTTLVYLFVRMCLNLLQVHVLVSVIIANILSILFAFFTNDKWVFRQKSQGWPKRLLQFTTARLLTMILDFLLAYILVDRFPMIIGQFVDGHPAMINLIESLFAQVTVIVLNYFISKFFVFKDKK